MASLENYQGYLLFGVFSGLGLYLRSCKFSQLEKPDPNFGQIVVSCPGKVLVSGGYLVLESPNIGISISTTARFYVSLRKENYGTDGLTLITVISPQFRKNYKYELTSAATLRRLSSESNDYIETCVGDVLNFIFLKLGSIPSCSLTITVEADNDFYSYSDYLVREGKALTSTSLRSLPPRSIPETEKISKTGLGSSATLITSLVTALLAAYNIIPAAIPLSSADSSLVHNLAQFVHCKAQGKVGSGFDVATAIYGTIAFSTFDKDKISGFLGDGVSKAAISRVVEDSSLWNQKIIPFTLPPYFDLLLGDVSGGSSSASMAKQVLKWRAENQESVTIWRQLADTNSKIYDLFQDLLLLYKNDPRSYHDSLQSVGLLPYDEWLKMKSNNIVMKLVSLRESFQNARFLLKYIGELAGVEIEPSNQSALLDASLLIPGVLTAGIPGAGGQDAVFVITLSAEAQLGVETLWSRWHECGGNRVCALTLRSGKEEDFGIQITQL